MNFTFDVDEITFVGWFTFTEEIVSNRFDFVLYVVFNLSQKNILSAGVMCECLGVWVTVQDSAFLIC